MSESAPAGEADQRDELRHELLESIDNEPREFDEIRERIESVGTESELRDVLLDLVDSNLVVANSEWKYRRRP